MLPKKNRLQLRYYKTFFSNARKKHTKNFIVFSEESIDIGAPPKVAIVVPAKKVSLATDRNSHKRKIRQALFSLIQKNEILQGINIVVYCKRNINQNSITEIESEIKQVV